MGRDWCRRRACSLACVSISGVPGKPFALLSQLVNCALWLVRGWEQIQLYRVRARAGVIGLQLWVALLVGGGAGGHIRLIDKAVVRSNTAVRTQAAQQTKRDPVCRLLLVLYLHRGHTELYTQHSG